MSQNKCDKCHRARAIERMANGVYVDKHDCVVDKAINEYREKLKMKIGAIPFSRIEVTNLTTSVQEQKAVVERVRVMSLL